MQKKFRTILALSFLTTCIAPVFGQTMPVLHPAPSPTITVRIHDYVGVPPQTLAHAEELTSEILNEAGVGVVWLECYPVPAEKRQPACDLPSGPLDFALNLVEQIQRLSPKLREIAMGLAVVPPDGKPGDTAYLSMHQAEGAAHEYSMPLDVVLGLGTAHEIGHLLLGANAHTASGLMKARWDANELKDWSHRNLSFTQEQARRMQSNVRTREKEASQSTVAIQIASAGAAN